MLVWAGTYTDIEDSGTMFNTGYWQYGEYITLSGEFLLQQQDINRQEQTRIDDQKAACDNLGAKRL